MARHLNGSNEVVFAEHHLMKDALERVVRPGTHVRIDDLVDALRNSRRYGVYFRKVNRYGIARTLSRWLRTGSFPNHVLISGVGVCHVSDRSDTVAMSLDFNLPKSMVEKVFPPLLM